MLVIYIQYSAFDGFAVSSQKEAPGGVYQWRCMEQYNLHCCSFQRMGILILSPAGLCHPTNHVTDIQAKPESDVQ